MGKSVVTYGNIKLVSPYMISSLVELRIIRRLNAHVSLYFTGVIPEDKKDTYVEKAKANDTIEVTEVDSEGGNVRSLFKGLVSEVAVRSVRGTYYFEVSGLSHSCKMDVTLKNRSFQNKSMQYKDLVKKVAADYPGTDFIDTASNSSQINGLIVQYNETDWQFLKRMASHFGSVLVPYANSDKPKFWFGLPKGKNGDIPEDFQYSISRNLGKFSSLSGNNTQGIDDCDFTYYEAESDTFLEPGDKVKFKDRNLVVAKSTAFITNGTLKYEYVLSEEKGLKKARSVNDLLTGASIEGKVIDVQSDTVRVHLDIDKEQKKDEAYWFKYVTNYTAEGNSGWYCMPQKDDHVKLYLPTAEEGEAVVKGSVRKCGKSQPKTADPDTRYLGTNHGKWMKLGQKDVMFTASEGKMFINLDEDKGVEIQSDQPITIKSDKNFSINVDKSLSIAAEDNIKFICNSSSLVMNGETYFSGSRVEVDGYIKAPISLGDIMDIAKDALLAPVDAALGMAAMTASVGSAVACGDYGEAALTVASCLPVTGTAIQVASSTSNIMNSSSGFQESGEGTFTTGGMRA
ncbi:MAG TPA: contractile injection system protein, VgrG/Pvc8 family [Clostridia bacterium]